MESQVEALKLRIVDLEARMNVIEQNMNELANALSTAVGKIGGGRDGG